MDAWKHMQVLMPDRRANRKKPGYRQKPGERVLSPCSSVKTNILLHCCFTSSRTEIEAFDTWRMASREELHSLLPIRSFHTANAAAISRLV